MNELADRGHYDVLLRGGQLPINRDREALAGRPFGVRKIAAAMAEIREARLQMERHGIVDLGPDAETVQVPLERIALRRADDELVVDVTAIRRLDWQGDDAVQARLAKQFAVARGVPPPSFGPRREVRRLDSKHRGLQPVHPEIPANQLVVV